MATIIELAQECVDAELKSQRQEAMDELLAEVERLRDALQTVVSLFEAWQVCDNWRKYSRPTEPCGQCEGCRAWQAAHDALAAVKGDGEVGDAE